ncbi:acyltransferase [Fundidesulfovibrio terrae]|uniref:acyltransferase n=1 Tax=Fundidesulfovibrio terrae TaxID=2922866 RepID=UPI001FAFD19A|nr:acyltransferase [Fundidesulfovibrio terrae]
MSSTPATSTPCPPQRFEYLDLLRCLAITGVTIMHSAAPLLFSSAASEVWSGLTYSSLCLFCVPSLLMISGALLLGDSHPLSLSRFYGKRFMKILVPLAAWSVIYYLVLCLQVGDLPHLFTFLKRFFTGLWSGPLWFLYMIVGVYLMVPFMRPAFSDTSSGRGLVFVGITFGLHALNFATRLIWEQELNRYLSGAVIPYYFGYFVLGHLLNSREVKIPGGKPLLALLFLACAGASAAGEFAAKGQNTMLPNTFFNYQQPLTVIMSASIFLLFKGWKPAMSQKRGRLVRELSSLSYGVFLSHVLILMLLTGQIPLIFQPGAGLDWRTVHPWVGPVLTGLATLTLSALLTAGLKRIPWVERIVP